MNKFKEISSYLILTIMFGFFTAVILYAFIDEYHIFSGNKTELVVIEKVSKKGLYLTPSYFVRVELPKYGMEANHLNRVTKNQLDQIELGDTVKGVTGNGLSFYTLYDVLYDGFFLIIGAFILGTLTLLGVFVLITEISSIDRAFKEGSSIWSWIKGISLVSFLCIPLFVSAFFSGRWLINLFYKIFPFNQTTTNAKIVNMSTDTTSLGIRGSVRDYEMTVQFEDVQGETYQIIKTITSNTYSQSDSGSMIEISYRTKNPHDMFITGTSIHDMVNLLFNFYTLMILTCLGLIIWIIYGLYKNDGKIKRLYKHDLKRILGSKDER